VSAALVTAADRWPQPLIDRWATDSTAVYGDGGAAIVVSTDGGFARLLSLVTVTDPPLEGILRGDAPFRPLSERRATPIGLTSRAHQFMQTLPLDEVQHRVVSGLAHSAREAAREADVSLAEIEHLVLPFVGRHQLTRACLEPLGLRLDRTTFELGRRIGHMGAADLLVGLNHLVESAVVSAGERILLIGSGGPMWTSAILEAT
jgi:3-oxoacyl-[acyl-carrier-protein] synthase-3